MVRFLILNEYPHIRKWAYQTSPACGHLFLSKERKSAPNEILSVKNKNPNKRIVI